MDQVHGTDHFPRYKEFIKNLQKNCQVFAWGMMDPKGDRTKGSSAQESPQDLRIVERRRDGIVVRGTKLHTTFGPACHWVLVAPCRALSEADKDFAVSFAAPIDAKGLKMIARPSPGPSRPTHIESPLSSCYLGVEAMIIFDDVFIPEERVFMCRQWDQAVKLPVYLGGCTARASVPAAPATPT